MNNYDAILEEIFTSIHLITDRKLAQLMLDRSVIVQIVSRSDETKNLYRVSYQGVDYDAYSLKSDSFSPGEEVYMLVPDNNFSNKKILVSRAARIAEAIDTSSGGGGFAFATISVSGQSAIVAETAADTLTIAAGTGITLTTNATTDTLTIAASGAVANDGTLTMATSGLGLSGSATFTANQSGNSSFTVTSNATSSNVANTIVARNSNGEFSAGNISVSSIRAGIITASSITSSNIITTTLTSSTANIGTLTGSLTATNVSISTLTSSNVNILNLSNTTLTSSNANITTLTSSNIFTTNLTVSTAVRIGTGSSTTPSFAAFDDTNTGIYFPAADTLAFVKGGAEVVRINSAGNVGIGTQTPTTKLEILGSLSASGAVDFAGNVSIFSTINAYAAVNLAGNNNSLFSLGLNRRMGDMFFGPVLTTGSIIIGSPTQSSSLVFGRSTNSHTASIAVGTVSSGLTKVVEIGTNGESGSFTIINIGSATLGALGTISMNENTIFNANVGIGTQTPSTRLEISGIVSATSFVSNIATGTAPFTVSSTTLVTNLNADFLDGQHGTYYLDYNNLNNKPTISDALVTITSGAGLTGTGTFSLNQYNPLLPSSSLYPSPSLLPGSAAPISLSLSHADTSNISTLTASSRTYVSGLTFDEFGHVTALTTASETVSSGVSSVAFSGGSTGLTVTGSPITTAGTITLSGTLGVANGGTGVTSSTGTGSVVLNSSPTFTGNIDFINGNLRVYKTTDLGAPFTSSGAIISIGDSTAEIDMSGGIAFVENLANSPNGVTMGMFYAGISNKFHIVGLAGAGSTVAANMTNAPRYVTIQRADGNMGIATQTPTTKLEVIGTISGSNLFTNRITASSITSTNIFATTLTSSTIAVTTLTSTNIFATTLTSSTINITSNISASTLYVGAGSATTPSISPFGDTNTGIFFPAADTFAITEGGTEVLRINSSGNVGIGTQTPSYKLQIVGDFAATTKSFVIPHPLDASRRLRYSSLEGPENGVYIRGRATSSVILLPDYFAALVDEDSITVHLNPLGNTRQPQIKSVSAAEIILKARWFSAIDCYYIVFAERKDVPRLEVEI